MFLAVHIMIALASVVCTTILTFSPTRLKIRTAYFLVAATLASGTFLVWQAQANMIRACTMGLLYIGVIAVALIAANKKLATESSNTHQN